MAVLLPSLLRHSELAAADPCFGCLACSLEQYWETLGRAAEHHGIQEFALKQGPAPFQSSLPCSPLPQICLKTGLVFTGSSPLRVFFGAGEGRWFCF